MIQIEDITGKSGALCEGTRFSAEDKLGNYIYGGIERNKRTKRSEEWSLEKL